LSTYSTEVAFSEAVYNEVDLTLHFSPTHVTFHSKPFFWPVVLRATAGAPPGSCPSSVTSAIVYAAACRLENHIATYVGVLVLEHLGVGVANDANVAYGRADRLVRLPEERSQTNC